MRKPLSTGQFRRGGAGDRDWNKSRARAIYTVKIFYRGNRIVKEKLFSDYSSQQLLMNQNFLKRKNKKKKL